MIFGVVGASARAAPPRQGGVDASSHPYYPYNSRDRRRAVLALQLRLGLPIRSAGLGTILIIVLILALLGVI